MNFHSHTYGDTKSEHLQNLDDCTRLFMMDKIQQFMAEQHGQHRALDVCVYMADDYGQPVRADTT